ncbi:hypothetical protein C5C41_16505 [Rathayibacter sp. AY1E9]|jgi:hypothetical protein|uniref:hypothetical protein n=1 Tax=unclassified Rathayibacter TaxID=2609250 RepID=UPI000CE927A1|nr:MULTISPECIES: hypothetical protein [unclassified Rathayibacter]PPF13689.1 hypothetical protein C5B92_16285 [Rathayibacter sp. AY1A4]PPG48788.1 hypothetical protein C5C41_16505 [Rathayibacter sp. AY1E9]PPG56224.1 hypothetical protein C5C69_16305 [Rathayibacter sp. AY1C7]PPH32948.1 hypothetical protein C5C53_16595 [Rathayibacter sp. AY1E3]PPH41002.1 hypothetical protein C5D09_16865 [Rathayibacter sp. AY1C9]
MSTPTPRELLAVHVATDPSGITATFTLGDPLELPQSVGWLTYAIELTGADGATAKHFGVRLSEQETKAFVFEFESATQANYDATHVTDRGASLVARVPDSSLGVDAIGTVTGFATIEGEDVAAGVAVQLLR